MSTTLRDALAELLSSGRDPARKHADDSPAKGRWVTFTVRTELVERLRAALAQSDAQPATSPSVPDDVLAYVHAYGDARADDDGTSPLRLMEAILAMRRWGATLAASPQEAQPERQDAYGGVADLRDAKWLDPECASRGACQSLRFEPAQPTRERLSQWTPMTERTPEPDTVCAVVLRYSLDRPPFVGIDTWEMHREDPTGMGGPALDMGYCWADNDANDVLYWMPLPAIPSPCEDPRESVVRGEGDV